jgi:hypothetical protein
MWAAGEVVLFDDSFEHQVWHRGSGDRLVLIVDFIHPGLVSDPAFFVDLPPIKPRGKRGRKKKESARDKAPRGGDGKHTARRAAPALVPGTRRPAAVGYFDQLVAPMSATEFLEKRWQCRPELLRHPGRFAKLLGLADVHAVLVAAEAAGQNDRFGGFVKTVVQGSFEKAKLPVQTAAATAIEGYLNGRTIVVENAEMFSKRLAELAQELTFFFGMAVHLNLYATPAGQSAFPSHTDHTDIFVLQLEGTKFWSTWDSPLLLTQGPRPAQYHGLPEPFDVSLNPGDVLYLPSNWIHMASTNQPGQGNHSSTSSLHLTITPKTDGYSRASLLRKLLAILPQYMSEAEPWVQSSLTKMGQFMNTTGPLQTNHQGQWSRQALPLAEGWWPPPRVGDDTPGSAWMAVRRDAQRSFRLLREALHAAPDVVAPPPPLGAVRSTEIALVLKLAGAIYSVATSASWLLSSSLKRCRQLMAVKPTWNVWLWTSLCSSFTPG